jgi:hypothetical protein
MSWVEENLQSALDTWNEKLNEIWQLITQSPKDFKGGGIWNVIVNIHGGVKAIGLGLLVLFFVVGVVKTCGSVAEVKESYRTQKVTPLTEPKGALLNDCVFVPVSSLSIKEPTTAAETT